MYRTLVVLLTNSLAQVFLAGSTVLFFMLDNGGRDEVGLLLEMLAEQTGETCLTEHKQRIASALVYIHAGFVLCVVLALLAMWLGDKTDLFNTLLSFLGFVGTKTNC